MTAKARTAAASRTSARKAARPAPAPDIGTLIGNTIRRMRRDRRMTLEQLAARTGISKS